MAKNKKAMKPAANSASGQPSDRPPAATVTEKTAAAAAINAATGRAIKPTTTTAAETGKIAAAAAKIAATGPSTKPTATTAAGKVSSLPFTEFIADMEDSPSHITENVTENGTEKPAGGETAGEGKYGQQNSLIRRLIQRQSKTHR
ncbi:UNVERIFIED_CONTAM: hypothetical protein Sindi_3110400 [Sesamum indicum]